MKKIIKSLAGILAFTLLATGCGGNSGGGAAQPAAQGTPAQSSGAAANAGDQPVTLRFSWWGADARHDAIQKVIDLYTAKHPNVTIEPEFGAWTGWPEKIITQLSGKTEADILQVNYNWVHSYGKGKNIFMDLNQFSEYIDLSNWDQEYLDAMTVGGELAAVPHGMNGRITFYNKAMFETAGIDYPSTYDEWIAAAKIVGANNTPTGADNNYVLINNGKECPDLFIAQMIFNATGKVMQVDGKVQYTVEEVADVLKKYEELCNVGAMPTFQQENPIDNESNPVWTGGNAGSIYEWGSNVDKWLDSYKGGTAKDEIGVANYIVPVAGTKPTIYVKPNMGYAISKNCKNPEVAADFLNFFFTDEEAVRTLRTTIGISSNKVTKALQESENMLSDITVAAYAMLNSYDQVVMDPYFEDANVRDQRYKAIESFRSGNMTAEAAAKDYVERQQAELDKLYK